MAWTNTPARNDGRLSINCLVAWREGAGPAEGCMREIVPLLATFDIDFDRVAQFLKSECKLTVGFESQTVGVGARSGTSSGLISYVLASLGCLSESERQQYITELLSFRLEDERPESFGALRANSWATMQIVLGLLQLRAENKVVYPIIDASITRYQQKMADGALAETKKTSDLPTPYTLLLFYPDYVILTLSVSEIRYLGPWNI